MKTIERLIAPLGFGLAGALFLFAAVKPALRGDSLDAAFLAVGVLFLVLGLGVWRKSSRGPAGPPR